MFLSVSHKTASLRAVQRAIKRHQIVHLSFYFHFQRQWEGKKHDHAKLNHVAGWSWKHRKQATKPRFNFCTCSMNVSTFLHENRIITHREREGGRRHYTGLTHTSRRRRWCGGSHYQVGLLCRSPWSCRIHLRLNARWAERLRVAFTPPVTKEKIQDYN